MAFVNQIGHHTFFKIHAAGRVPEEKDFHSSHDDKAGSKHRKDRFCDESEEGHMFSHGFTSQRISGRALSGD